MSKYVLVETVSQFRMRYVVELKDSDPSEWALDTVTMNEATEFGQSYIGEHIVSHRDITEQELVELFREDNSHLKSFTTQEIISGFVTTNKG